MEEEDCHFDGACGAASSKPTLHFCELCNTGYEWYSWMCYIQPHGSFAERLDQKIHETMSVKFKARVHHGPLALLLHQVQVKH